MSQSLPSRPATLKALYGVRCEDSYELHELMREVLERARIAHERCYVPVPDAKPGEPASVCIFPEHSGLLCSIVDELEQFLGEEGGAA